MVRILSMEKVSSVVKKVSKIRFWNQAWSRSTNRWIILISRNKCSVRRYLDKTRSDQHYCTVLQGKIKIGARNGPSLKE